MKLNSSYTGFRIEKCNWLQKSIPKNVLYVDLGIIFKYNRIEKCNYTQKSFVGRLNYGNSQRFLLK